MENPPSWHSHDYYFETCHLKPPPPLMATLPSSSKLNTVLEGVEKHIKEPEVFMGPPNSRDTNPMGPDWICRK